MKGSFITTIFLLLILSPIFGQVKSVDNSNLQHQFYFLNYIEVYKNIDDSTFVIAHENGEILFNKLKFCKKLTGPYLQVLNHENQVIYLDDRLEEIDKPKIYNSLGCANITIYKYELRKKDNSFFVTLNTDESNTGYVSQFDTIASFNNQDYEKVYFINKKQELTVHENLIYPTFLIFEQNSKYGVIDNKSQIIYDSISIGGNLLKIEKDGLWNFYNYSPFPKYKVLDQFEYNLAYFELPGDKSGYLDKQGNEYLKK